MFRFTAFLLAVVTAAAAYTVEPLVDATSGGSVVVNWTSESSDPGVFSVQLVNVAEFRDTYAIANNVQRGEGEMQLFLDLPLVPTGDGYTIRLHEISDINNAYAVSAPFYIGDQISTTLSSTTSTTSSSSSSSSSSSGVAAGGTTTATTSSSAGFGVTRSSTPTPSSPSNPGSSSAAESSGSGYDSFNGGDNTDAAFSLRTSSGLVGFVGAMVAVALF